MRHLAYFCKYPILGVAVFVTIIPIIIMLLTRGELKTPLRVFFWYLVAKFIIDLIRFHFASYGMNNLLLGNINALVGFILISLMFYNIFLDDGTKRLILIIAVVFSLIFMLDFFYSNPNFTDLHNIKYVTISLPLKSAIILLFCMMFFSELIKELYMDDLVKSAIFWIVCGILIYSCVLLFITSIYNSVFRWGNDHNMQIVLYVPYIFETIFMTIVSIGLIKGRNSLHV